MRIAPAGTRAVAPPARSRAVERLVHLGPVAQLRPAETFDQPAFKLTGARKHLGQMGVQRAVSKL